MPSHKVTNRVARAVTLRHTLFERAYVTRLQDYNSHARTLQAAPADKPRLETLHSCPSTLQFTASRIFTFGDQSQPRSIGVRYVSCSLLLRRSIYLAIQANYQFTRYVAEAANTFSNFVTLGLALYGIHLIQKADLPSRYLIGWIVSAVVLPGYRQLHRLGDPRVLRSLVLAALSFMQHCGSPLSWPMSCPWSTLRRSAVQCSSILRPDTASTTQNHEPPTPSSLPSTLSSRGRSKFISPS